MSRAVQEYGARLVAAVAVKNARVELLRASRALAEVEPGLESLPANAPLRGEPDGRESIKRADESLVDLERVLFLRATNARRAAAEALGGRVLETLERVIHGGRS